MQVLKSSLGQSGQKRAFLRFKLVILQIATEGKPCALDIHNEGTDIEWGISLAEVLKKGCFKEKEISMSTYLKKR